MRETWLVILLGVLWGVPFALTKISLETIPPVTLTAARVCLAAAALWIVAVYSGRKFPRRRDLHGRLFFQGMIACVIPYTLIALGQQSVDSGLAAILNSTTPLFVCLIGVSWTHHEPITSGRITGAAIGLGGVVLIVGASALARLGQPTIGQSTIILAAISSAASVIHGRRFNDTAPELVAAGTLTFAAIILVPLSIVTESPWHIAPSMASVMALGCNAIGATALGFVIYFHLIRTVGSMGTASTGYLKPATGVLIGSLWLGEALSLTTVFGLLAILLGIAAINGVSPLLPFSKARSKRTSRPAVAEL